MIYEKSFATPKIKVLISVAKKSRTRNENIHAKALKTKIVENSLAKFSLSLLYCETYFISPFETPIMVKFSKKANKFLKLPITEIPSAPTKIAKAFCVIIEKTVLAATKSVFAEVTFSNKLLLLNPNKLLFYYNGNHQSRVKSSSIPNKELLKISNTIPRCSKCVTKCPITAPSNPKTSIK